MSQSEPSQRQMAVLLMAYEARRLADAEKLATLITLEFPDHELGWKVLGATLKQLGRIEESLVAKQKSVALAPDDPEAHNNLGVSLQELGRLADAEASFRQAIALKPDLAEAHNNLGITLQESGISDQAAVAYREAIRLKPDFAEAYCNLGAALQTLGRLEEATVACRQAISLNPDFPTAFNNLGNTLFKAGRLDLAAKDYRQAIALKRDYAEAYRNLGVTLQALGDLEQAESNYLQAIVIDSKYAEAYRNLISLKRFEGSQKLLTQMKALHSDKRISDAKRCQICFALAKAYEDQNDFSKAFRYYNEGNALRHQHIGYNRATDIELFARLKANYQNISKLSLQVQTPQDLVAPIFIIGMPRSGTTLVEQIISSHSKVTGGGELPYVAEFGDPIASGRVFAEKRSLQHFRQQYLDALGKRSDGKLLITDKLPFNFKYLGLITAALPEAKIVHVIRDPAAVCWANYKQYFESAATSYCYDLGDTLNYYYLYENLMRFWNECFPERVYHLDYEKLTSNQEEQIRSLLAALELDWEHQCLEPESNARNVQTASNTQIRQRIYQGSSEHWKAYRPYLNGALDRLDNGRRSAMLPTQ